MTSNCYLTSPILTFFTQTMRTTPASQMVTEAGDNRVQWQPQCAGSGQWLLTDYYCCCYESPINLQMIRDSTNMQMK